MNRRLLLFVTLLILNGILNLFPVFSQEISDPESEYRRIRAIAFEGDYTTAAAAARKLVNAWPSYGDARILLGRILSWQKDFKQAAAVIDTLLATDPDNEELSENN